MSSTLYKRDSKGNLRIWRMEQDGGRYRTISGLADGKQVTTEWTEAQPKNVGKANATTAAEQAAAEIQSAYDLKLRKDYHTSADEVDVEKFVKPMLAKEYGKEKKKITFPVFVQPKLDGIRCIANSKGLWSRTGKRIDACPHIEQALAGFFAAHPSEVLDGELYNHDLRDNFNEIVSMVRKQKPDAEALKKSAETVQFHVYDHISDKPFDVRFTVIADWLRRYADIPPVQIVPTTECRDEAEVDQEYGRFIADGYEGGIIRRNGPYEQKRSSLLLKRKDFEDAEFEIVSVHEGQGNWSGVAKVVTCLLEDGRTFKATIQGGQDYAKHVLVHSDSYIGKQATVQFFTRTPDGVPRFPIAKVLHKDERW